MASTTMVHIRVDEKLKREACAALDGMGLSLSDMSILYAAFNINMTRLTPEEMAEENKEFVAE